MSDIFDHALDAFLEQLDDDRWESVRELRSTRFSLNISATCKRCKTTGLKWIYIDNHWYLHTKEHCRHRCSPDTSGLEEWKV
jgi:hypothetical protein